MQRELTWKSFQSRCGEFCNKDVEFSHEGESRRAQIRCFGFGEYSLTLNLRHVARVETPGRPEFIPKSLRDEPEPISMANFKIYEWLEGGKVTKVTIEDATDPLGETYTILMSAELDWQALETD